MLPTHKDQYMTEEDFFKLADKYAKGTASEKEVQFFEDFLENVHGQSGELPFDAGDEEEVRARLLHKINKRVNVPKHRAWLQRPWIVGMAASLVLIATMAAFFVNQGLYDGNKVVPQVLTVVKSTDAGQKSTIYLNDGSVVRLNSESKLIYGSFENKAVREVELVGEAYFEVARNPSKPFMVKTGNLTTTVLGTEFNINSYNDNSLQQITVASGKVSVENVSNKHKVLLTANEQVNFDLESQNLTKDRVDARQFTSWKDDVIYLNNVSLHEATRILERWYGANIVFANPAIKDCKISGKYQNDGLVNILEGIKFIKNIEYEIKSDQTIVLSGEPCK